MDSCSLDEYQALVEQFESNHETVIEVRLHIFIYQIDICMLSTQYTLYITVYHRPSVNTCPWSEECVCRGSRDC